MPIKKAADPQPLRICGSVVPSPQKCSMTVRDFRRVAGCPLTPSPSPARGEGGRVEASAPLLRKSHVWEFSPLSPPCVRAGSFRRNGGRRQRGRGAGGEGVCHQRPRIAHRDFVSIDSLVFERLSTIDGYCLDLPLTEIDFDLECAIKKGTLLFDLPKTGLQQPEDPVQIPGWWNLARRFGRDSARLGHFASPFVGLLRGPDSRLSRANLSSPTPVCKMRSPGEGVPWGAGLAPPLRA